MRASPKAVFILAALIAALGLADLFLMPPSIGITHFVVAAALVLLGFRLREGAT